MANQLTPDELSAHNIITVQGSQLFTTSLQVAKAFNKQHRHLLEKIAKLPCTALFRSANFSAYSYTHPQNNETYTAFNMTKDGFLYLVMGFTGKKAALIKEAYIAAFNKMHDLLFKPVDMFQAQYSHDVPVTTEADIINSHALAAHCRCVYEEWHKRLGPALKMMSYPGFHDLDAHITLAFHGADNMNLKKRITPSYRELLADKYR